MPAAVRHAEPVDVPVLAPMLARAFHDDPVQCWVYPSARARGRWSPRFFAWALSRLIAQEVTWTTSDRSGAALWALPGRWKETSGEAMQLLLSTGPGILWRAPRIVPGLAEVERRHPATPHLYLAVLGVEPQRQGDGVGSSLIAPGLDRCDADRLPAYLETATERNLGFYARHGFEVVDELTLPRDGPTLWRLWRDPR